MLSASLWKKTSLELLLSVALGPVAYFIARQWLLRPWPGGDASVFVLNWWAALAALSVVNVALWLVSHRAYTRRSRDELPAGRANHLWLSGIYVLGCAQRSLWPKVDVQRFVLTDWWPSSVFVGRSIATIAELAFAAQWALLLHEYSREGKFRAGRVVAWMIVPMLALAQGFCWFSVLTTNFLGHTCEESLWTTAALLVTACAAYLWVNAASQRGFLGTVVAFGLCYVMYMMTVDVPMYVSRWEADQAAGRVYLTVGQGLSDVIHHWHVTYRWADWGSEISWLTLYFSCAVWASVACAHAPRYRQTK